MIYMFYRLTTLFFNICLSFGPYLGLLKGLLQTIFNRPSRFCLQKSLQKLY